MPTAPKSRTTDSYQSQEIIGLTDNEAEIIRKKLGGNLSENEITDLNLTLGDLTVLYDSTHGIQIEATGKINYKDGKEDQPIVNLEIPLIGSEGIHVDKSENEEKVVITLVASEMDAQFKTLFGNQHIVGSGNIDLFEHDIQITGENIDVVFTIYSSKNTKIDSLTDLKTVAGDMFTKSCTGVVNGKAAYAITQSSIKLIDGTAQLLTNVTFNDTLMTI